MLRKLKQRQFLFEMLVKRDFTKKYKRTVLGMAWSIISPLVNLLIMWLVFNRLLGANIDHYVIYLFAGQLLFSFFTDATNMGMTSLLGNAGIISKLDVPKYMFLLSQIVSSFINFSLTLLIFFLFTAFDGIPFTWKFLFLVYPTVCISLFNLGIALILSALFIFFRDMQYLWGIFSQTLMWLSAIFYTTSQFSDFTQRLYYANPLYVFITYYRDVVLSGVIPGLGIHLLCAFYTALALLFGAWMYKRYNHEFLYYI